MTLKIRTKQKIYLKICEKSVVAFTFLLTSETNMDFGLPSMEMFLCLESTAEKHFSHATLMQMQRYFDNLKQRF